MRLRTYGAKIVTQIKRLFIGLAVLLSSVTPVLAEPTPDPQTEQPEEEQEPAETYAVDIEAEYAILIDTDSGTVLFEKHSEETADPASLVKIMSVYLASEALKESDSLTMSSAAFQTYDHDVGVLWIRENETLSVRDCAYATMLASANDTCAMLAEGVSGSVPAFVDKMNETAASLGLEQTQFANPFGVYSQSQYTTAKDMASLLRSAMKNSAFREVFGASSYTIQPTNQQAQARPIQNDCEMLINGGYFSRDVIGGKIGSTPQNGYALAVCAKREASGLIAVVLQEETADAAYRDTEKLLEYGFASAKTITITPEDIGTKTVTVMNGKRHVADVTFEADSGFNVLMPSDIDASALESEIVVYNEDSTDPEHITAEVIFSLNGEKIASEPLVRTITTEPVKEPAPPMSVAATVFDIASVVLLVLMIMRPLVQLCFNYLRPPK